MSLGKSSWEDDRLIMREENYMEDDAYWQIIPRFTAKISQSIIWQFDNLENSRNFSQEVTLTTGLKITSSKDVSTKVGLTDSLKAAVSASASAKASGSAFGVSAEASVSATASAAKSSEIQEEITQVISSQTESTWSSTSKTKFQVQAKKYFRVFQEVVSFKSLIRDDNCELTLQRFKAEERDTVPLTNQSPLARRKAAKAARAKAIKNSILK